MYKENVEAIHSIFQSKLNLYRYNKWKLVLSGVLAGAYVTLAIILILTLGTDVPNEWKRLVMGLSFGIALVLIVFAGADLFTGYPLYAIVSLFRSKQEERPKFITLVKISGVVWVANFFGAVLVALIYYYGDGLILKNSASMLYSLVDLKINKGHLQQFCNGILCNWLVCLAIWMYFKLKSETTKLISVSWCLFVFIASGYEHSVANMGIFSLSLFGIHNVSLSLIAANLLFVTLGNVVGGAIFVGGAYVFLSKE